MRTWRMIDDITASARCPPLQSGELAGEPWHIEQVDKPAIQEGQEIAIQLASRFIGDLVADP